MNPMLVTNKLWRGKSKSDRGCKEERQGERLNRMRRTENVEGNGQRINF